MKSYTVQNLAKIIGADCRPTEAAVTSVSTDSRSIKPASCFFAITGPNFDGHSFINDAFAKGAICAVINSDIELPEINDKCILRVDDTVKTLGALAAHYRKECGFKVIAITGSAGKTSTRHIIANVLSSKYRVFQAPKNFNNEIGLPLTLLNASPQDEFVVTEIGANKPGEIAQLSKIARPDIAIVTNVHPAHLEGFGCLETIAKEKLSIIQGLADNGTFLINGDYKNLCQPTNPEINYKTFGFSSHCDIKAENPDFSHTGSKFDLAAVPINIPLAGRGNMENTLAAWAVCSQLGFTAEQFAGAVRNLPPVPMRAEIKRFGSITVIDDCYNANPGSMKNALELLSKKVYAENSRSVFICGDMGELGAQSEHLHEELGRDIARSRVRLVIAVGPLSALAAKTAKQTADYDINVANFADADTACDNLYKFIKNYDIILVKASRAIALEKVVQKLRELFAEQPLTGNDKN